MFSAVNLKHCSFKRLAVAVTRCYSVRVRFAPSPTGSLHLGGFRTALLNFVFAQQHRGDFLLRIEDTDQDRAIPGAAQKLEEDLEWLNIPPTESPLKGGAYGPYTQSKRLSKYREEARRLVETGAAYPCYCSENRLDLLRKDAARRREKSKYDGKCGEMSPGEARNRKDGGEAHCIRFRLPPPPHQFTDIVYGAVSLEEGQGDFVILKSDGYPTYHLASVVDDHLMEISHVLRGVEWQVSTGKHLALYRALGYKPPEFAHLPLILNRDGSKLSKRQSDISIDYYRITRYYPEALVNFVVGNRNRIESIEEITSKFDLQTYSKSSNRLDFSHLEQLNQLCLKKEAESSLDIIRQVLPGGSDDYYRKIMTWCPPRVSKLTDLVKEFSYLSKEFQPSRCSQEEARLVRLVLTKLEESTGEIMHSDLKKLSSDNEIPIKSLMHVLRKSLCGVEVGPPIFEIVNLLGRDESIRRLKNSLN